MKEKWNQWNPQKGIASKMYIEKLIDDKDGTLLVLKSESEYYTLRVLFENSVLSFRSTDEGKRLKTINFLEEEYGTDFYANWTFFKVVNSTYIDWFNQETYNMYAMYNIEHYVFLTSDDIIEILSTYEPVISVL